MNLASKDVASDFAGDGRLYLNNASVSIMPQQSIEAMNDFLTAYNIMGPDSIESGSFVSEKLQNTRKTISKIINCRPEEVILTQSTTEGVNFVANGLSFPKGSNIIIRGGLHEHHANYYPWLRLQDKTKINDMQIDEDGFFDIDDFGSSLDEDTKLVVLSHALYNTGAVLPVEEIGKMVGDGACFFVDSAQTVGGTQDVDVSKINCDFMSFNGSKWLCGPMGTGLFYCNRRSSELLEPVSIGGESAVHDGTGLAFLDMPKKFQTGFRNYVGMVGLESAASYLLEFGLDNIRSKNRYLSSMLREEMAKINGITLYGPQDPESRTSIVSFNLEGIEPEMVTARLEKDGIILAVREIFDKKIVRASPHFFNTEAEMIRLVDALKRL